MVVGAGLSIRAVGVLCASNTPGSSIGVRIESSVTLAGSSVIGNGTLGICSTSDIVARK